MCSPRGMMGHGNFTWTDRDGSHVSQTDSDPSSATLTTPTHAPCSQVFKGSHIQVAPTAKYVGADTCRRAGRPSHPWGPLAAPGEMPLHKGAPAPVV